MSDNIDEVRHGVASVARRGPPSTTSAGPFASACEVSGRDKRLNLADQEKESIMQYQTNSRPTRPSKARTGLRMARVITTSQRRPSRYLATIAEVRTRRTDVNLRALNATSFQNKDILQKIASQRNIQQPLV